MNYFYPDVYQKSIYTIKYEKLKENGIKCLLFDLDNTCVPYVDRVPTKKLKNHFDKLQDMGFKVIIFSNSPKERLKPFKKELNVDFDDANIDGTKFEANANKYKFVWKPITFHKKNTIFIHVPELKNIKDLDKLINLILNIKITACI